MSTVWIAMPGVRPRASWLVVLTMLTIAEEEWQGVADAYRDRGAGADAQAIRDVLAPLETHLAPWEKNLWWHPTPFAIDQARWTALCDALDGIDRELRHCPALAQAVAAGMQLLREGYGEGQRLQDGAKP